MARDRATSLLSTGEFAQRTRLSPGALRIYHRGGLLLPAVVEANGYRRYRPEQVRVGQLIGLLRGAGIGLVEIRHVLEDLESGVEAAADRLERFLAEREREHANCKLLVRHIQTVLREEEESMFTIKTRHVGACRVMTMQRRLRAGETDRFAREAKAAFMAHLDGATPTGPFTLIFHGVVSDESDGPLEAVLGCPEHIGPTEVIGVRTEPAHDEAYTTITKAQWQYPAILAAYDAVARSPEVTQRMPARLSCREVYLAAPDAVGNNEAICDVAFPLGAAQEVPQSVVKRAEVPVMFKRAADHQAEITRAWAELESAVGSLRGRKFYGVFNPKTREYRACAELLEGDDPHAMGLEQDVLAGGRFARVRLNGEPPAVYQEILPASKKLAQRPDADRQAPSIEYYRRRDVIDLLQPLCD